MYEKGTFIYRLAGREREKSASYYTPEVLTKCLVKYALKELLADKSADDILNLTICEPAMGSAAFLNETINQLADAYVNKKQEELGILIPYEDRFNEVQKVKMFIADRNVYGVDLNSTAVELAEVSLWLNTICEGGHIPWFGTQIVNGNSLIGARKQVYRIEQLQTNNPSLKWYTNAPDRIAPGETRRGTKEVYHFLLGDPGMCSYNDKVIKGLSPKEINLIKEWNKQFTESYNPDDIESLIRLSGVVDTLWHKQIELRKEVKKRTADKLSIFGHDDNIEESHTTIKQKDYIFRNLYKTEKAENAGPYARLKFAMDYWCALWFWPIEKANLLPDRETFIFDMSLILEGGIFAVKSAGYSGQYKKTKGGDYIYEMNLLDYNPETEEYVNQAAQEIKKTFEDLGNVNLDQLCEQYERLALVREIAKNNHFMHWELEFAELFEERGGFDLMIGNPPWIKIEWNEQGVLSDAIPYLVIRNLTANEAAEIRNKTLERTSLRKAYFNEYEMMAGEMMFLNSVQNYHLLKGQQTNLFKCFLPQSWDFCNKAGFSAFVHPDGVYDDPHGSILRKELYPRLRYHFQFQNERKLFQDVANRAVYSLNIYSNKKTDSFDSISNLFIPSTIDGCYETKQTEKAVGGIKNENGEWNTIGHPDRIIVTGKDELLLYAKLFDGNEEWECARLPVMHAKSFIDIFRLFSNQPKFVEDFGTRVFGTKFWDETNSQKDNILIRDVHFPISKDDSIYSGPHIGVANPIFQTSQRNCSTHRAFDVIDLSEVSDDYSPRCNYSYKANKTTYLNKIPDTPWNEKYHMTYRVVAREMANLAGERTVIPAIYPPGISHICTLYGVCFANEKNVPLLAGLMASLPYDFYFKATGKGHINADTVNKYPFLDSSKYSSEIILRSLMLNCLTNNYSSLWKKCWNPSFVSMSWSKTDSRLHNCFSELSSVFSRRSSLRSDFERRQALVEIDVLTALSLKMTLNQLITAYNIQFPVLQMYENDTWYDQNGRIVFTANRGLSRVGLERQEWDQIKDMKYGSYKKTFMDDTIPGGPVERTIEYVAPFIKCDRVEDYKTAWEFFSKKYGEVNE